MNAIKLSKELGEEIKNSKEYMDYKNIESKVINSPSTIDLLDRFNGVQALLKDYLENNRYEDASRLKDEMNTLYDGIIENDLLSELSIRLDKVYKLRDQVFKNIDDEIKVILKPPRIKTSGCGGCSKSDDGCNGCSQ